jgi:hypothetical protein
VSFHYVPQLNDEKRLWKLLCVLQKPPNYLFLCFLLTPVVVSQNFFGYFVFSIVEEDWTALIHLLPALFAETSVLLLGLELGCCLVVVNSTSRTERLHSYVQPSPIFVLAYLVETLRTGVCLFPTGVN